MFLGKVDIFGIILAFSFVLGFLSFADIDMIPMGGTHLISKCLPDRGKKPKFENRKLSTSN